MSAEVYADKLVIVVESVLYAEQGGPDNGKILIIGGLAGLCRDLLHRHIGLSDFCVLLPHSRNAVPYGRKGMYQVLACGVLGYHVPHVEAEKMLCGIVEIFVSVIVPVIEPAHSPVGEIAEGIPVGGVFLL